MTRCRIARWATFGIVGVLVGAFGTPVAAEPGYAVGLQASGPEGPPPRDVRFQAVLFAQRGGKFTAAVLDFGDGAAPHHLRGSEERASVTHTYRRPGSYTATLTATTSEGERIEATRNVKVDPLREADPAELLEATPAEGIAPLVVKVKLGGASLGFVASSALLDFGDGSGATGHLATTLEHTYREPGTYRIALIVRGEHDNVARAQASVRVVEKPTLALRVRPRSGVAPLRVDVATSLPAGVREPQLLLDGVVRTGDLRDTSFLLSEPGDHEVRLVAKAATGETLSESATVTVTRHGLSGYYEHDGGLVELVEDAGTFLGRFVVVTSAQAARGYQPGELIVKGQYFQHAKYAADLFEPAGDGLPMSPLLLAGGDQTSRGEYKVRHEGPTCPAQWAEYVFGVAFDDGGDGQAPAHVIDGTARHAPWVTRYERAFHRRNEPVPQPGIVGKVDWVGWMIQSVGHMEPGEKFDDCVLGDDRTQFTPARFSRVGQAGADRLVENIRRQLDESARQVLDMARGDGSYGETGSDTPSGLPAASRDPVLLHSGELFCTQVDLAVPGRGELSWRFQRTYRSASRQGTSLGHGWTHDAMHALVRRGDTYVFRSARGAWITLTRRSPTLWTSPSDARLVIEGDRRTVRDVDGMSYAFDALPSDPERSRILEVRDAAGNRMTYRTDVLGRVQEVDDPLGRTARYRYGPHGLLEAVEAPDGSRMAFEHDLRGDLVAARRFAPGGDAAVSEERYAYARSSDPALDHNLIAIWRPGTGPDRPPSVAVRYGDRPGGRDFDRVVWQREGEAVEEFAYATVEVGGAVLAETVVRAAGRATSRHRFRDDGMEVSVALVRASGEEIAIEREFDAAGRLVRERLPLGATKHVMRDGDGLPTEVRIGPRTASDLPVRVYRLQYEPVFKRLKAVWGPFSGTVPTDPSALERALQVRYDYDYEEADAVSPTLARFGIARTWRPLGDVNSDGRTDQAAGLAVRVLRPAEPSPNGVPREPLYETFVYDAHGLKRESRRPGRPAEHVDYHTGLDGTPTYPRRIVRRSESGATSVAAAFEWDDFGRMISLTTPHGGRIGIVRDALGRSVWSVPDDPMRLRRRRAYDVRGAVTEEWECTAQEHLDGATGTLVFRTTYDARGLAVREERRVDDRRTVVTTSENDRYGRLSSRTKDGTTTSFERDDLGRVVRVLVAAADGAVIADTRSTYGPEGDLATLQDTAGAVERYEYDGHGRLARVLDAEGRLLERDWDLRDNLVEQRFHAVGEGGARGRLVRAEGWTYTPLDRIASAWNGIPRDDGIERRVLRTFEYDAEGRVVRAQVPGGTEFLHAYADGYLATLTERGVRRVSFGRDEWGRVARIESRTAAGDDFAATADVVLMEFDAWGRRRTVERVGSGVTRYEYDGRGRTTAVRRFSAGSETAPEDETLLEYDGLDRVLRLRRGIRAGDGLDPVQDETYAWEGADRLTALRSFGTATASFTYDAGGRLVGLSFFGLPGDVTVLDASKRAVTTTDARGWRTRASLDADSTLRVQRSGPGAAAPAEEDIFTFDTSGRATGAQRGTWSTRVRWDGGGRPIEVTATGDGGTFTQRRSFDAKGRLASLDLPSGTRVKFETLDPRKTVLRVGEDAVTCRFGVDGRLAAVTSGTASVEYSTSGVQRSSRVRRGDVVVLDVAWEARAGRVESVLWTPHGAALRYARDARGRLVSGEVLLPEGARLAAVPFRAVYDARGNRTAYTLGTEGSRAEGEGFRIARVDGGAVGHDPAGRVTAARGWTYEYGPAGTLVRATDAATGKDVRHLRDATHRVVRRTSGSRTTDYVYDGSSLVAEAEHGRVEREYLRAPGGDLVAVRRGERLLLPVLGPDGSVLALVDAAGTIVERHLYDVFGRTQVVDVDGRTVPEPTSRLGFAGMPYDAETGLCWTPARTYAPHLGRFLEPDPLGPLGGEHPYEYAKGDSLTYRDPTGLETEGIEDAVRDAARNPHDADGLMRILMWVRGLFDASTDGLEAVADAIERGELDPGRMSRATEAIASAMPDKERMYTAAEIHGILTDSLMNQMFWEAAGPLVAHGALEIGAKALRVTPSFLRDLVKRVRGRAGDATGVSRWAREAVDVADMDRMAGLSGLSPITTQRGYRPTRTGADRVLEDAARAAGIDDVGRFVDDVRFSRDPTPHFRVEPNGVRVIQLPHTMAGQRFADRAHVAGHELAHAEEWMTQLTKDHHGDFDKAYAARRAYVAPNPKTAQYALEEIEVETRSLERLRWYTGRTQPPEIDAAGLDYTRYWSKHYLDQLRSNP